MTSSSTARLVALSVLLSSSGCDEDPELATQDAAVSVLLDSGLHDAHAAAPGAQSSAGQRAVVLHFGAQLSGAQLACGEHYDAQGSQRTRVQLQDFRFFVSDVQLLDANGTATSVELSSRLPWQTNQVALLDFTDGAGACSSGSLEANTILTGTVAADRSYRGIRFTVGVPEALNNSDPARQAGPLQAPGAHWSWRDGYRYLMAELLAETSAHGLADAGTVPLDAALLVDAALPGVDAAAGHSNAFGATFAHIGATACDGTAATGFHCRRPNRPQIELRDFDPLAGEIVVDVSALFADVDLSAGAQCHGSGESCNPFYRSLGIDPESGMPSTPQRVFRGE